MLLRMGRMRYKGRNPLGELVGN